MVTTITDRLYGESSGVAVKAPVIAVAVGAVSLSGLAPIATLAGSYTPSPGDRILVPNQTDPTTNGIYNASVSGWTRSGDFDGSYDVVQGTLVLALFPSSQALLYQLTTPNPVIGTSPLNFSPYANLNTNYPQTPSEAAGGYVPVSTVYPPGDLRRWGVDLTGGTDSTAQINTAIAAAVTVGGPGFIYHPGGTIAHASQIVVPVTGALAVVGSSRAGSIFKFTGNPSGSPASTRSAWRYVGPNVTPFSGYANVFFRHVQIFYQNSVNFAAAIELNAYGMSYFEVDDCWIKGGCSYGVILDGVEIGSVHNCLIENTNAVSNFNVWIVNGTDRGFTAGTGFSNIITIRENQLAGSTTGFGLIDDGGNEHVVQGNNFNGHATMAIFSGVTGLKLGGNSFENLQTTQNASANVRFTSASAAGNPVGPCIGIEITACGFFGNMSAGGAMLSFGGTLYNISGISKATSAVITFSSAATANPFVKEQFIYISGVNGMTQINDKSVFVTAIGGVAGAWTVTLALDTSGFGAYTSGGQGKSMHTGFVKGCNFASVFGRGAAIDVTFLANSECSCNVDYGLASMFHYAGVHNDSVGNDLALPQSGSLVIPNINGPLYGDTRAQSTFLGGVAVSGPLVPATPGLTAQTASIYAGVGAPNNANGNNGDYYLRSDTPSTANQRIYVKAAGAWSGIV